MAERTTKGSGTTNNNGGSVLHGGNVSATRFANVTAINNTFKRHNWGYPVPGPVGGFKAVQLGSAVTITAITQSGSTGYVNIEKSSHGLSLGDRIVVYGANVTGYNTVHTVTVVTDANNVKTDVFYSADTSTHGSYKAFSGNFNAMTAGSYMGMIIGKNTSGSSISGMRIPGGDAGARKALHYAVGNQRYNITSWNAVTGAATKGGSAGSTVTYINIGSGSSLTSESEPSRAVPGELVYSIGKNTPTMADYAVRNG